MEQLSLQEKRACIQLNVLKTDNVKLRTVLESIKKQHEEQ